ncbi:hypothetical protein FH972_017288 [Carpinus fangiana]|uniref:Uncharacterized protein n=1 Tax=Carpinus fangiana TaxID=176857 RepID=A0A5N6RLH4_9ROSI|nr:hypothetical protein FH972_017288 [Carpinus fangiana]
MGSPIDRCNPKPFWLSMIWLAVTKRIAPPQYWQICLYLCIGANSRTFANIASIVPSVNNFPQNRGLVLGILKGYAGLNGAIVSQLSYAIYGDDSKSLILFIGWFPVVISLVVLPIIHYAKVIMQLNDVKVFYNFLYISLGLAGFLMILIIVQEKMAFTHNDYVGSAVVVIILLFLPLLVVFAVEYKLWKSKKLEINNTEAAPSVSAQSFSTTNSITEEPAPGWKNLFRPPKRGEDYTIPQAVCNVDMITILIISMCGFGGSLAAVDNLSQIGSSYGYSRASMRTFMSLLSTWNYLGQLASGCVSDIVLQKYKFPHPLLLTMALLVSCVDHLLIAVNVPNELYAASVIIEFCLGAQAPLLFAIILELLGLKYYSILLNYVAVTSPLGLYLLNVKVTGHLYNKEAEKQMAALGLKREAGRQLNCSGGECYKLSFIIITAVNLFGALASLISVVQTWSFYKIDIYDKF